jgi:short-subunit dehydrogenase involved in D-alanine esterification of teichoic acids
MIWFIKKLKNYFDIKTESKIIIPDNNTIDELDSEHICELKFKLTKNDEIDIEFMHSDISDMSSDEISAIAEKYANLIVLVNNGLLKKEFLATIKNYKKKHINNSQMTLLLDNILFFNNLLQQELRIIRKEYEPMIRPSSVFKSL